MRTLRPSLLALTVTATAIAVSANAQQRAIDAHTHGVGELTGVFAQGQGLIEWHIPAESIVGFEHAPENDAQSDMIKAAVAKLETATAALVNCTVTETHVEFETGGEHDEDEHGDDEHGDKHDDDDDHHDDDHKDEAHHDDHKEGEDDHHDDDHKDDDHKDDDHKDDDHKDEAHHDDHKEGEDDHHDDDHKDDDHKDEAHHDDDHKESEHAEHGHDDDHADHDDEEGGHAEFHVELNYSCTQTPGRLNASAVFAAFPDLEHIEAALVVDGKSIAAEIEADSPTLDLK